MTFFNTHKQLISNIAKMGPKYNTSIDENTRQFSINIISQEYACTRQSKKYLYAGKRMKYARVIQ